MRPLGRHLGHLVSPLVDGQLDPAHEERIWSHVLGCPPCRTAVEQEIWVKQNLASIGPSDPPEGFTTALVAAAGRLGGRPALSQEERTASAWATVAELERRHRTKRAGIALLGVGTVSAAIVGLGAVSTGTDRPAPGAEGGSTGGGAPTVQPVAHMGGLGTEQP